MISIWLKENYIVIKKKKKKDKLKKVGIAFLFFFFLWCNHILMSITSISKQDKSVKPIKKKNKLFVTCMHKHKQKKDDIKYCEKNKTAATKNKKKKIKGYIYISKINTKRFVLYLLSCMYR